MSFGLCSKHIKARKANCRGKCRSLAFWLDAAHLFSAWSEQNLEQLISGYLDSTREIKFLYLNALKRCWLGWRCWLTFMEIPGEDFITRSQILCAVCASGFHFLFLLISVRNELGKHMHNSRGLFLVERVVVASLNRQAEWWIGK